MQWADLLGHDQQQQWFRTALANRRLATSFLFVGPEGVGKRTFARLLAKSLLCRKTPAQDLNQCGLCEDCVQVDASTHPDLIEVSKPADKAFLPIELLIGEREKRMREGLCHDISLRPYGGRRKIAILDDADTLNAEGANCLLKTLEEPPINSLLILIGTSLQRQLPTIRSRCQAILFRRLENRELVALIERHLLVGQRDPDDKESQPSELNAEQVLALAEQSEGSIANARLLLDHQLQEFRMQLVDMLTAHCIPMPELMKEFSALVDAAGKDNRLKRDRMKLLFQMAAAHFRSECLRLGATHADSDLTQDSGLRAATRCWSRCLEAVEQVDRNANQAALIEAWTTDVAQLCGR